MPCDMVSATCELKMKYAINAQKAARVEIDNGNDIQVIEIDSEKPFAIVLPGNAGVITFYDVNGEVIEYGGQSL